jgi:UDP-GlcNAc3NAcA epimerase
VVFPVHPRARKVITACGFSTGPHVRLIEPVGYLEMVGLTSSARLVLTDSGGLQKEAYWLRVPCLTLRDETELVETVQTGWNVLVGSDTATIVESVRVCVPPDSHSRLYGDGRAAKKSVDLLPSLEAGSRRG